MKKTKLLLLSLLSVLVILSSCKKDDPKPEFDAAEALVEAVEAVQTPATVKSYISAGDLYDLILSPSDDPYMIDIRSSADYTAHHIDGAVNVAFADLLTHVEDNATTIGDEQIVIICYSGQTAAYGNALLRLSGFDSKSLLYGMSKWNSNMDDPWENNYGDATWVGELLTSASPAKAEEGPLPTIVTSLDTGEEILAERVAAVFDEGFSASVKISAQSTYDNRNNDLYYIINYWPETDYLVGHIPGAINYEPGATALTLADDLETLPKDKTIVVYCYSGQTSAHTVAYLRVLGYNAKTLVYGANSFFHSTMPGTPWAPTQTDLPVVPAFDL